MKNPTKGTLARPILTLPQRYLYVDSQQVMFQGPMWNGTRSRTIRVEIPEGYIGTEMTLIESELTLGMNFPEGRMTFRLGSGTLVDTYAPHRPDAPHQQISPSSLILSAGIHTGLITSWRLRMHTITVRIKLVPLPLHNRLNQLTSLIEMPPRNHCIGPAAPRI